MSLDSSALIENEVFLSGELNINRVAELRVTLLRAIGSYNFV